MTFTSTAAHHPHRRLSMRSTDAVLAAIQESAGTSLTIAAVAVFPGPAPTPARLGARLRHRFASVERLRLRPETDDRGRLRQPYAWLRADDLDPARHITDAKLLPGENLDDLLAELVGRGMPETPDAPLWEIHVVPDAEPGHHALVLRAHHALLDGSSLFTVLRLLGDDPRGELPAPADHAAEPRPRADAKSMAHAVRGMLRRAGSYACNVPVESGRTVLSSAIPGGTMEAARNALPDDRGSANDVFLAAVTAALDSHPALLGDAPRTDRVYTGVPVDLRDRDTRHALGNHVSAVRVRMPLGETDALARLREVRRQMNDNKRLARAQGLARLTGGVSGLGLPVVRGLARQALRSDPRITLNSTLPQWGREEFVVDGRTARSVFLVSCLAPRSGLTPALTRYGAGYTLCVTTDSAHSTHARPFTDAILHEIRALAALGETRA
ncbi:WS/DGAT domain-containing protein [Yinghuangia sp. ASG 101]|uniref:wax ester/triacylglycerol synthase domain-containing protein n=1 Tax=Yinghuangia sp. ASG 101 TaxID=2896848 RepID=UPI001E4CD560|nr:wax ester/triacylglycerol synthase domain-containing protein [Yinghuangia sp. ASG 101]UGQ12338.1 WS/DGAT domain-containing protein [Yinghuangia sp. ASG 101]